MPNYTCSFVAVLACGLAQAQSVQFTVTHDDPNGVVNPGQVVRIRHHMSRHSIWMVAEWAGDGVVSPARGEVGQVGYMGDPPLYSLPMPFVYPGQVAGGGVVGVGFFHPPPGTGGSFPLGPWTTPEVDFLVYDWTAPTEPGLYEFAWRESQTYPGVRGYQFSDPVNSIPVMATYVPMTLTVIPAPATVALPLAVLAASRTGTRRRASTDAR